jgi:hypothetical protein
MSSDDRTILPRYLHPSPSKKEKSVTHVSGTTCHPMCRAAPSDPACRRCLESLADSTYPGGNSI